MSRKIGYLGMTLAIALILSYVESLIPFSFGVLGMKLGLPNAAILFALAYYGEKEAALISFARVFMVALLFGNVYSFLFSLCGAVVSLFLMTLLFRYTRLSIYSISITGAIGHNMGQLLIAILVVKQYNVIFYFPVLFLFGGITGLLIGIVAREILKRLKRR